MTNHHGLYRSRTDKVFGGVCGGLARSLNTDPFIIRLVFALLFIMAGSGILLYIIMWIALPEEPLPYINTGNTTPGEQPDSQNPPTDPMEPATSLKRGNNGPLVVGLILILIGMIFLADRFMPHIHFRDFWPVIIIIAGIVLIATSFSTFKKS